MNKKGGLIRRRVWQTSLKIVPELADDKTVIATRTTNSYTRVSPISIIGFLAVATIVVFLLNVLNSAKTDSSADVAQAGFVPGRNAAFADVEARLLRANYNRRLASKAARDCTDALAEARGFQARGRYVEEQSALEQAARCRETWVRYHDTL